MFLLAGRVLVLGLGLLSLLTFSAFPASRQVENERTIGADEAFRPGINEENRLEEIAQKTTSEQKHNE